MRLLLPAMLPATLVVVLAACATAPAAVDADDTVAVTLAGPGGPALTFTAEVAAAPATRRRGLKQRTELPPDRGMLFVFPADTTGAFWMKDTLIPLSIAFADAEGTVVAVLDMEPCTAEPCPRYRPGVAYRLALEVNRGALAGAAPGWRLDVDGSLPPGL